MRNLARCYLAQNKPDRAIAKAVETIQLCRQMGENQTLHTAELVLAESLLATGEIEKCELHLEVVEENLPSPDSFILGSVQRIRGLAALADEDREIAVHHFSRSLTIFETAEDLYYTALAHLLIGLNLENQTERAVKHLVSAGEIFRRLGIEFYAAAAQKAIEQRKNAPEKKRIEIRQIAFGFRRFAAFDNAPGGSDGFARTAFPRISRGFCSRKAAPKKLSSPSRIRKKCCIRLSRTDFCRRKANCWSPNFRKRSRATI